jgi:hypothetical protein
MQERNYKKRVEVKRDIEIGSRVLIFRANVRDEWITK